MTSLRVLAATANQLPQAELLVFEYLATTQGERGRTVPATIDQLPGVLHTECVDLAAAYSPPGTLLIASWCVSAGRHGQLPSAVRNNT